MIDAIKNYIETHAAYVRLFDTPDGKIVLRHIMHEGFVLKSTHVAGDPHTSAMNEGSRRLALSILKHIHRDHHKLINELEERIRDDS